MVSFQFFPRKISGKVSLCLISLCFTFRLLAQEVEGLSILQEMAESLVDENEAEIDVSEMSELLHYYSQNPIDINTVDEKTLEQLGILTPFKILMILEYRQKNGSFFTLNELSGVEGLSVADVLLLKHFVKIKPISNLADVGKYWNHRIILSSGRSYPLSKGYIVGSDSIGGKVFQGNPYYLKTRYRAEYKSVQAGITLDTDAGEQMFSPNTPFTDFSSAFIKLEKLPYLKNLIIGDYNANFGQGLVLWNGFSAGKGSFTQNIRKLKVGFSPYTSVDENKYFRGIASTFSAGNLNLSLMLSSKMVDATLFDTTLNGRPISVSSLKTSGIHASPADIRDKKLLGESNYAIHLAYDKASFKIGLLFLQTDYSLRIEPKKHFYNFDRFSGKSWNVVGANYLKRGRKLEFFGEIASSSNGGWASINGIQWQVLSNFSYVLLYRNFQSAYYSAYANSFAQNSQSSNEKGLYTGMEFLPQARLRMAAYADFFINPWLKSGIDEPSSGRQFFMEVSFQQNESKLYSIRYTLRSKYANLTTIVPKPNYIQQELNHKWRLQYNFKITEKIELRNRLEMSFVKNDSNREESGFMFYQDFIWKASTPKLSFFLRYAVFNTGGWESRMYAFENDLLYNYSFPAYYGKGTRFYLMCKFSPLRKLNITARYSLFAFFDREMIGSGTSEINSSQKSDIACQLSFGF